MSQTTYALKPDVLIANALGIEATGTRRRNLPAPVKPSLLTRENAKRWRNKLLLLPMEKEIWDSLIEDGQVMRIYANLDVFMLAALCIEAVIYFRAQREISGHAMKGDWHRLVFDKGGAYKGVMAVGNKCFEHMQVLANQCGISPAARARIVSIDSQQDMFEAMNLDAQEAKTERLLKLVGGTETATG
jgi:phage terminase small subunit